MTDICVDLGNLTRPVSENIAKLFGGSYSTDDANLTNGGAMASIRLDLALQQQLIVSEGIIVRLSADHGESDDGRTSFDRGFPSAIQAGNMLYFHRDRAAPAWREITGSTVDLQHAGGSLSWAAGAMFARHRHKLGRSVDWQLQAVRSIGAPRAPTKVKQPKALALLKRWLQESGDHAKEADDLARLKKDLDEARVDCRQLFH